MDWTDFSKQSPKDIGYYVTYCTGIGVNNYYVICWWDGVNFTNTTANAKYPMIVTVAGITTQSCSVAFFSELTKPPQA